MTLLPDRARRIVESSPFTYGVIALIGLNAVVFGMETYPAIDARFGAALGALDRIILWIFVIELAIRWIAWTPRRRFLMDGWNLFDFIVIGAGFVPATSFLSIMRIFRVLRILRAIRVLPSMQRLVITLLQSIPALGHILLLALILFYVYGVIGTLLYREAAPQFFGSLHGTMLTLFQIATLENWPEIHAAVSVAHPAAWIYIVSFILLGTFVLLNLVVGVIVSNLQTAALVRDTRHEERAEERLEELRRGLTRIESEIARLSRETSRTPGSPPGA